MMHHYPNDFYIFDKINFMQATLSVFFCLDLINELSTTSYCIC